MITVYPDLIQGTDEWLQARAGIVTASTVGKLLTPTLQIANNEGSRGLALTLAAERITGHVDETFSGPDMWRGHDDEPFARDAYGEHYAPVTEVGLIVREYDGFKIGCSPDGLVGDNGLIEIKSRLQKIHMRAILEDRIPTENVAQVQCELLVSGREWVDYVSYCGGMPLYVKRVHPDRMWHAAILDAVAELEDRIADATTHYLAAVEGLPMTERTPNYMEMSF